jgi:hypothetical protein
MKIYTTLIVALLLFSSVFNVLASGMPPYLDMRMGAGGVDCVVVSNPNPFSISGEVGFRKKFADGTVLDQKRTFILEQGGPRYTYICCDMPSPGEEIFPGSIRVLSWRRYGQ